MQDFLYLNYHTEYSCSGKFNKDMDSEACFSFVFSRTSTIKVSESYDIILYKGLDFTKKKNYSNACLFKKSQIRKHLEQAQGIFPFDFTIKSAKWNSYKVFIVSLNLVDLPGTFHKYILTWVRYMYEYPYNMFLFDAYRLKKETCFRFTSIANLFNMVLSCYGYPLREIHQITKNQISKNLRKKDIRARLEILVKLNNIYDKRKYKKNKFVIPEKVNDLSLSDIEYWENDEIYEQYRKPVYMELYNTIIKKK